MKATKILINLRKCLYPDGHTKIRDRLWLWQLPTKSWYDRSIEKPRVQYHYKVEKRPKFRNRKKGEILADSMEERGWLNTGGSRYSETEIDRKAQEVELPQLNEEEIRVTRHTWTEEIKNIVGNWERKEQKDEIG